MKNNDELLEQMIKEEYEREAKEEEAALLDDDSIIMPAGKKEDLYLKICGEIEKLEKAGKLEPAENIDSIGESEEEKKLGIAENAEKSKADEKPGLATKIEGAEAAAKVGRVEKIEIVQHDDLYANMSEEDRKALEIGRRVMEAEAEAKAQKHGKVVYKKKRIRMYVGIAAALVLAMAVGVTSMGGPEKIIKMMTQMVGNRELERVDSSENNLIIVNEDEDEAYQKIAEKFGVQPVKVMLVSEDMKFVNMKFDEVLQTAELYYEYDGNKLSYLISASHTKGVFGFEIADEVIDEYTMEVHGKKIVIKKYQVGEEVVRYSASFKEMGLKYFLYGIMEQSEFELIVENLHFLW